MILDATHVPFDLPPDLLLLLHIGCKVLALYTPRKRIDRTAPPPLRSSQRASPPCSLLGCSPTGSPGVCEDHEEEEKAKAKARGGSRRRGQEEEKQEQEKAGGGRRNQPARKTWK